MIAFVGSECVTNGKSVILTLLKYRPGRQSWTNVALTQNLPFVSVHETLLLTVDISDLIVRSGEGSQFVGAKQQILAAILNELQGLS